VGFVRVQIELEVGKRISPRCRVPRCGFLTRVVLASCSKGFGSPGCVPHRLGALPLFPFALGWLLACWFLSVGNSASASDLPLRKRGRGKVAMVCWERDVGLGLAPSGPPFWSHPVGMSVVVVPFSRSVAPLCPVWLVRGGWFHSIVAPLWPRAGLPAWFWLVAPALAAVHGPWMVGDVFLPSSCRERGRNLFHPTMLEFQMHTIEPFNFRFRLSPHHVCSLAFGVVGRRGSGSILGHSVGAGACPPLLGLCLLLERGQPPTSSAGAGPTIPPLSCHSAPL